MPFFSSSRLARSFAFLIALRFLQHQIVSARMIRNTATLAPIATYLVGKERFEGWRPGGGNSQMAGSSLLLSGDVDAILFDSIKTLKWSK